MSTQELSVYYCSKCGRYGYYQLIRNAVCHSCNMKMTLLNINFLEFLRLSPEERDNLLIHELLSGEYASAHIANSESAYNRLKIIAAMNAQIQELTAANRQLNKTIDWMHQTIWELLSKNRELRRQLEQLETENNGTPPASV